MSQNSPLTNPYSRSWKCMENKSQSSHGISLLMPGVELSNLSWDTGVNKGLQSVDPTKSLKPCSVCESHQSRYTCPRCQAPYCSVQCYRKHTSSPTSAIEIGREKGMSSCTEAFYQNRVSSILQLEVNEQKSQTKQFLNRHYHDELRGQQEAQCFFQSEDLDQAVTTQLSNLLIALERAEKGILSQEELFSMVPLHLKSKFQEDLRDGKLSHQVLERWHPWWRRDLGPRRKETQDPTESLPSSVKIPLDERLLDIPLFATLRKSTSASKAPHLLFNLIDILYSYVWTLRLFYGMHNVERNQLEVDFSTALIQYSSVLHMDSRHTSLEQVISNCTASSTKHYPSGCNASWTVLVTDCSLLLTSHRLVGRALLEVTDLLKTAIRDLKKTKEKLLPIIPTIGHMKTESVQSLATIDNMKEDLARFRKVRKKIEFYLSWSQASKEEFGSRLEKDVRDWMEKWRLSERNDGDREEGLQDLLLPTAFSGSTPSICKAASPQMVEISTRRKEQFD